MDKTGMRKEDNTMFNGEAHDNEKKRYTHINNIKNNQLKSNYSPQTYVKNSSKPRLKQFQEEPNRSRIEDRIDSQSKSNSNVSRPRNS